VQFAIGDILGLGHSIGPFGYTLALILTWFVIIGAVVNAAVFLIVSLVLAERRENNARIAAYDAAHKQL
jgi:hypothetical protein